MSALVGSTLVGWLLTGICVAAAVAQWAVKAWDRPRSWSDALVTTALSAGGLLLVITMTRFALLSGNGG